MACSLAAGCIPVDFDLYGPPVPTYDDSSDITTLSETPTPKCCCPGEPVVEVRPAAGALANGDWPNVVVCRDPEAARPQPPPPSPPTTIAGCHWCHDFPSFYMRRHGLNCSSEPFSWWMRQNRCRNDEMQWWQAKRWCQLSCFTMGAGYDGDRCCPPAPNPPPPAPPPPGEGEWCQHGILDGDTCCDSSCGSCGGKGCASRPGGQFKCCPGGVEMNGKCTEATQVACVVPATSQPPPPSPPPSAPPLSAPPPAATPPATCVDIPGCPHLNDGDCDDGGPGSDYDICDYGTDCSSLGVRG